MLDVLSKFSWQTDGPEGWVVCEYQNHYNCIARLSGVRKVVRWSCTYEVAGIPSWVEGGSNLQQLFSVEVFKDAIHVLQEARIASTRRPFFKMCFTWRGFYRGTLLITSWDFVRFYNCTMIGWLPCFINWGYLPYGANEALNDHPSRCRIASNPNPPMTAYLIHIISFIQIVTMPT